MENEPIILPEHVAEIPTQPKVATKRARRGKESMLFGVIVFVAFAAGVLGSLVAPALVKHFGERFPNARNGGAGMDTGTGNSVTQDKIVAEDSLIISLVEKSSPAVVSVVAKKDVSRLRASGNPFGGFQFFFGDPFGDQGGGGQGDGSGTRNGTEKQKVGSGTGFFVSQDGLVVTNKHVVSDAGADYSVLLPGGKEYKATVLARSPSQDIAVLKVDGKDFPTLSFGDSGVLKVGQTVIAIGNSLGEFSNSVSRGIISGLGRSVTAGVGYGDMETLSGIIQTDAAINPGNSGGPLLDISGKVIGINVAMAQGAQNVGFSLPVSQVARAVEDVQRTGKISAPYLGIRYAMVDETIQQENNLPYAYGAIVLRGTKQTDFAVIPGSPADKAGIVENDIILEINGQKLDTDHPLGNVVAQLRVGDTIILKVWHKGRAEDVKLTLEERV
jgi:serine protease Do